MTPTLWILKGSLKAFVTLYNDFQSKEILLSSNMDCYINEIKSPNFCIPAVDQAVSYNDQAVLSDLLSVITLRPSIWNLDLCTALLPPIGDLLQSKYEM